MHGMMQLNQPYCIVYLALFQGHAGMWPGNEAIAYHEDNFRNAIIVVQLIQERIIIDN